MNKLFGLLITSFLIGYAAPSHAFKSESYLAFGFDGEQGKYKDLSQFNFMSTSSGFTAIGTAPLGKFEGYSFNTGLGYYLTDSIRMEVTISSAKNLVKKKTASNIPITPSDISDISLVYTNYKLKDTKYAGMLNFYYDMMRDSKIMPFLTAGIGLISRQPKLFVSSQAILYLTGSTPTFTPYEYKFKRRITPAYQIGLGFAFKINNGVYMDVAYKHYISNFSSTCKDTGSKMKDKQSIQTAGIGLRINF
jgi:opacity protein-like surface antigen